MSFTVKRLGNFLKISNKDSVAIYNLQHITFIDITKIFNKNYLSITDNRKKLILDSSLDNPTKAIDEICDEIKGWKRYTSSIYNKKL